MRYPVAASVAALALALGASSCSTFDPNAATVNGEEIKRRDFEHDLHSLRDNEDFVNNATQPVQGALGNSVSTDFAATELTNRIMAELVHQELSARRLLIDPAVSEAVGSSASQLHQLPAETYAQLPADYRATFEREVAERFTLGLNLNDVDVAELSETAVEGGVRFGLQVCVLVIPAATEDDAQAALEELAGGADYATVAATYSIDPGLAQSGGQLRLEDGSCPSGQQLVQLGEEFVTALDEAEIGTDVGPLEVQGAFVVARVESVEGADPSALPLQLVTYSSSQNQAFSEWLTAKVADAEIDVDPRYGRWDAAVMGVVSPANDTPTTVPS